MSSCACNILRRHQENLALTRRKVKEGNVGGFARVTQGGTDGSSLRRVGAECGYGITFFYSPLPRAKCMPVSARPTSQILRDGPSPRTTVGSPGVRLH